MGSKATKLGSEWREQWYQGRRNRTQCVQYYDGGLCQFLTYGHSHSANTILGRSKRSIRSDILNFNPHVYTRIYPSSELRSASRLYCAPVGTRASARSADSSTSYAYIEWLRATSAYSTHDTCAASADEPIPLHPRHALHTISPVQTHMSSSVMPPLGLSPFTRFTQSLSHQAWTGVREP